MLKEVPFEEVNSDEGIEKYGSDVVQEQAIQRRSEHAFVREMSSLGMHEAHPAVLKARHFLQSMRIGDLIMYRDLFYQRALDGDRGAAVAYGSLRMFADGKRMPDRYFLGLATEILLEEASSPLAKH
ncbi:MAG: hypothetical protein LHW56_01895 [Candidatus Cloacimonetes bacterium]|nr:hypothetical protein [Candidatus Cloacimonadota bacterium]MDY0171639.1 hypothetical protein [Candidatus Cloacimonadaceae bacterium]